MPTKTHRPYLYHAVRALHAIPRSKQSWSSVPVSSVLASSATAEVDGCERFFSLFRSIPAKERPVTATPSLTNVKSFPSFLPIR